MTFICVIWFNKGTVQRRRFYVTFFALTLIGEVLLKSVRHWFYQNKMKEWNWKIEKNIKTARCEVLAIYMAGTNGAKLKIKKNNFTKITYNTLPRFRFSYSSYVSTSHKKVWSKLPGLCPDNIPWKFIIKLDTDSLKRAYILTTSRRYKNMIFVLNLISKMSIIKSYSQP